LGFCLPGRGLRGAFLLFDLALWHCFVRGLVWGWSFGLFLNCSAGLRDDGTTALGPILRELLRQPSQIGALIQVAVDARAARTSLVQARHAMGEAGVLRFGVA